MSRLYQPKTFLALISHPIPSKKLRRHLTLTSNSQSVYLAFSEFSPFPSHLPSPLSPILGPPKERKKEHQTNENVFCCLEGKVFKTKVKEKELNPTWNEPFEFKDIS